MANAEHIAKSLDIPILRITGAMFGWRITADVKMGRKFNNFL